MILRPATLKDVSQLAVLKHPKDEVHRLENEENAKNRVSNFDPNQQLLLVHEENQRVIAQVVIRFNGTRTEPGYPNLQDLYVENDFRGKGLGTKIIQECEGLLKEKGYTKVGVQVNPTLNCKAHQLYEKLGYKDVGREPYLDGVYDGDEDWVIDLVKELK